jgi:hypothetical protein
MHVEDRILELERAISAHTTRIATLEGELRGALDWLACQGAPSPPPPSGYTPITLDILVDQSLWVTAQRAVGVHTITFPDDLLGELGRVVNNVLGKANQGVHAVVGTTPASELRTQLATAMTLLRALEDGEPCWFDHHGGCQAHGFLGLQPGEKCPNGAARELLEATAATEPTS